MKTVTKEYIDFHKSIKGGWTRKQVEALGASWPLKPGWQEGVIGREISDEAAADFETRKVMLVTAEWLEQIRDEQGLTRGQTALLERWDATPGKLIPEDVGHFILQCRGYRGMPQDLRDALMLGAA